MPDNVEKEGQARALLDQIISLLQSIAHQNANVVDKMKLMQISRNMVRLFGSWSVNHSSFSNACQNVKIAADWLESCELNRFLLTLE